MNIKVSVYDFFAYTIPGGLILFTVIYALDIFGVLQIDFLSLSPSIAQSAVIIGASYIIGLLFDPIGKLWYRLFKPKNYPEVVLRQFQKVHPNVKVSFEASDWSILFAYIKRQYPEVASGIERVNASCIMLRNISLGFILLVIIEIVKIIQIFSLVDLILAAVLIIFSIIAGRESVKYAQWFYVGIFENIVSSNFKMADLNTSEHNKEKIKNSQKVS